MTRYIAADDFLDLFYVASAGQDKAFIETVEIVVVDTPTADVAPVVHGKWTTHRTEKHDGEWYCTECDYEPEVFTGSNFCPNCGAKMDLED